MDITVKRQYWEVKELVEEMMELVKKWKEVTVREYERQKKEKTAKWEGSAMRELAVGMREPESISWEDSATELIRQAREGQED